MTTHRRSFFLAAAWIIASLVVLAGCAKTSAPGEPPSSNDAGVSPEDGGSVVTAFDLELELATRFGEPVEDARVSVDTADGEVVEGTTDERGRVTIALDEDSAPWDVTVAHESYKSVTTIVGVTGPIEGPIHMGGRIALSAGDERTVSGSVTGLDPAAVRVELVGPGISKTAFSKETGMYTTTLTNDGATSVLRVLALEFLSPTTRSPSNGVWIESDRAQDDLTEAEIAFPSPAPQRTTGSITVQLPAGGALDASDYVLESGLVHLIADEHEYEVGALDCASNGGVLECSFDALGGEVSPTDLELVLMGPDGQVVVDAAADSDQVVVLPEVAELSSTGGSLDDLRFTARAGAYGRVGASAMHAGGQATWYVYSYAGAELEAQPWPHMPSGLRFTDVGGGVSPARPTELNLFALGREDGSQPWDWRRSHHQRAVIKTRAITLGER